MRLDKLQVKAAIFRETVCPQERARPSRARRQGSASDADVDWEAALSGKRPLQRSSGDFASKRPRNHRASGGGPSAVPAPLQDEPVGEFDGDFYDVEADLSEVIESEALHDWRLATGEGLSGSSGSDADDGDRPV